MLGELAAANPAVVPGLLIAGPEKNERCRAATAAWAAPTWSPGNGQLRSDRSPEHIAGPIRLDYPEDQIMRISGRPSPAEVFNLALTAALATCMHRGDHSMVLPVSASIVLASGGTAASALSLSLAGLPSSSCNMRWALGARSDSG